MVRAMQWWNYFTDWFNSTEGSSIVSTMILPFLAIVIAGIVAALVARGAVSRLIARQERAQRASAVEALIAVGEKASQWSGLSGHTRDHFEAQTSVASVHVRLLPATGSAMASAWAEYQLADIKRNSANFSVQADQGFVEYRDRLIEWHHRPGRAKKLFAPDLERFRIDSSAADTDLVERQRRWKAEQSEPKTVAVPIVTPAQKPAPAAAPVQPAEHLPTPAQSTTQAPFPVTSSRDESLPSAPIVPPASSRLFTPHTTASPATGSTDVIEATIDEDTESEHNDSNHADSTRGESDHADSTDGESNHAESGAHHQG
ncbi:MAG: hypothetical protein JWM51_1059 [Microbacteriaceae bacterium]|nr:hypothetical protein [Microbacteriaceae bacterium]